MGGKRDELKIYGVNACLAFFASRPEDLVRAWLSAGADRRFGDLMKFCALQRLAYHIVDDDELERVTNATHHEGVCLLVRRRRPWSPAAWLKDRLPKGPVCVLGLPGVGNPHNIGSVLRSAAHFGVPAVCIHDSGIACSGSAVRTAEGGAEAVEIIEVGGWPSLLAAFREAGFEVVATSSRSGNGVFDAPLPERTLLLLGAEGEGLPRELVAAADRLVKIPGTGAVESLNVSATAAILLSEFWRCRKGPGKGPADRAEAPPRQDDRGSRPPRPGKRPDKPFRPDDRGSRPPKPKNHAGR